MKRILIGAGILILFVQLIYNRLVQPMSVVSNIFISKNEAPRSE